MKEKFACISGLVTIAKTAPSDRGLELVAHSMWSTMTVTGVCFLAVLFAFLTVKVGRSVSSEAAMTSVPISVSFLLTFSGLKYIHNHIRHHLFQTPLQPRRRYSSLKRSNSWIQVPGLFRRSSSSTAKEVELLNSSNGGRRSSLSNNNNSNNATSNTTKRHSSIKRASLPTNVYTESSAITNSVSTSSMDVPSSATATIKIKSQTRRNTMPSISVLDPSNEPSVVEVIKEPEPTIIEEVQQSIYMIAEEEKEFTGSESSLSETTFSEANSEQLELALADLEAEVSKVESIAIEDEEEAVVESSYASSARRVSPSIEITKTVPSTTTATSASTGGVSSFRSSYLNYLPESIFGYSTTSIFAKSPDAPPGFTKRSTSEWSLGFASTTSTSSNAVSNTSTAGIAKDFTTTSSTTNTLTNDHHQPLYARKPATSGERESRLTSLFSSTRRSTFSTLNASAPQFVPSGGEESLSLGAPERAATASPRLDELQNTSDLFAPINWNYQESEMRRAWGGASEFSNTETGNSNSTIHSAAAIPERRKRAMSAYASSSIFN